MISKRALLDGPVVPLKGLSMDQIEEQFQRIFLEYIDGRSSERFVTLDGLRFSFFFFSTYACRRIVRGLTRAARVEFYRTRNQSLSGYVDEYLNKVGPDLLRDALAKSEWLTTAQDAMNMVKRILTEPEINALKDRLAALSAIEIELIQGELVTVAEQANALKQQVLNFEMAA